jgi:hypothetical protein
MLRAWVRAIGIVSILVGFLSFKFTPGISPERNLSLFHNLVDLGLLILLSFLITSGHEY